MQIPITTDNIRPTHTCFDDAIDTIVAWIKGEPTKDWHSLVRLAHGICDLDQARGPFAHAWIEMDGLVFQSGIIDDGRRCEYAVTREEFYSEMKARDVTLYTLPEMGRENAKSGHYGPWKAKYHALTRNPDKRTVEG